MPQRPLQTRLHLHVPEITDGEVQVHHGLGPFIGVVLQYQLSQLEAGEGQDSDIVHFEVPLEVQPGEHSVVLFAAAGDSEWPPAAACTIKLPLFMPA